ncbi:hypothetical protein TNCV_3547741 [Trichonephila clavipes]|nr:hypothetical protein TNCV_3547741 [Trichonephila clavipes]
MIFDLQLLLIISSRNIQESLAMCRKRSFTRFLKVTGDWIDRNRFGTNDAAGRRYVSCSGDCGISINLKVLYIDELKIKQELQHLWKILIDENVRLHQTVLVRTLLKIMV